MTGTQFGTLGEPLTQTQVRVRKAARALGRPRPVDQHADVAQRPLALEAPQQRRLVPRLRQEPLQAAQGELPRAGEEIVDMPEGEEHLFPARRLSRGQPRSLGLLPPRVQGGLQP